MEKKIAVIGASGRMGKEICELFNNVDEWSIAQKVGRASGGLASLDPNLVDIVVDFSHISTFDSVLSWCLKHKKPLVSGTTGLDDQDMEKLVLAGQEIPLLWSANMSLGIAWLSEVIRQLAPLATDFDFQIEEIHHRHKVDSPSGTAKHLQRILMGSVDEKAPQPLSIRGGGVFGVHKVYAMSEEEVITLEHQALNRTVFARGAVKAVIWLIKQRPGLYSTASLLKKDTDG